MPAIPACASPVIRPVAPACFCCGLLSQGLKISKAFDEKERRDVRPVKVAAGSNGNTRDAGWRHLVAFDLNGRVPAIENILNVLVFNAPRQMIMKADTDLCIIKGLRRSEAARNHAIRSPFLALQPPDGVDCSLNDSGVLN